MGGTGCRFELVGPAFQLLGLAEQEIAAGIDPDIVQLRRLPPHLLDRLEIALVLARHRGIVLVERGSGL